MTYPRRSSATAATFGGTLTVVGDKPLVVLAEGDVHVIGTIDVSARGPTPGPSGGAGASRPACARRPFA
jgi:hypothetical protein